MARSSGYSGHPLLRGPQNMPLLVLSAAESHRLEGSVSVGGQPGSRLSGDGVLHGKLQVAAPKGDTQKRAAEAIFLLTCTGKPIIINSFHRGRGARVRGLASFLPMNPLGTSWNQTRKRLKRRSPYPKHKKVYFSWLSDAETPTGASPSLSGRWFRPSRNSSRLCTSTSSPPTSICALHGCGSGHAGT